MGKKGDKKGKALGKTLCVRFRFVCVVEQRHNGNSCGLAMTRGGTTRATTNVFVTDAKYIKYGGEKQQQKNEERMLPLEQ